MAEPGAAHDADGPSEVDVPGSAGPLRRSVERLADGRRLTLYRTPSAPASAQPPEER